MALTPQEEKELAELEELERLEAEEAASPDAQHAAAIAPHIDPALPVTPQVLATQPATTHPGGDEAAQSDWAVRGADSAKGTTIVYEPTVNKAREELLSKPELVNALFPDGGITPEFIQMMDESSDIYKTYADHKWDEARWAAADSGQTLYRQSRMPWLGGEGSGLSPLSGLVTKVRASIDPVMEGAQSFILGVDDSATLGMGRRAGEALDRAVAPDKQKSLSDLITGGKGKAPVQESPVADAVRGGKATGGVSEQALAGADPEAVNEMLIEQSPGLHVAGQLAGMFTPGGVLGALGKGASALTRGAGALASRLGGGAVAQGAAKLAGAGVAAATGGAALQAGREGVEAGANLGKTGETGTTLGEAAGRSVEAGLDPLNLGLGVGGEALGMAAGRVAKGIAQSPRYGGNVERVEQLGGKIKFGKGPVGTPGAEAAIVAGKARDISGQDVMAEQLAPRFAATEQAAARKVADAETATARALADAETAAVQAATAAEQAQSVKDWTAAKGSIERATKAKEQAKVGHAEFKERYFQTREGQQVLPPTETIGTNLKMLREKMTPGEGGKLRPVGDATGVAPAKGQFNADIQTVSLKPSPGALELTPDEAEMFLAPTYQRELLPKPKRGPPPAGKPPADGPQPNKQGVNVIKPQGSVPVGEAPTVPPKGKAAKPAGKVEGPAERDVTPTKFYPDSNKARDEYGQAMRPYREAQRADNLRASKLADDVDVMAERTGEQLGSSKGGFFRGSDGVERYVKQTSVESQALDEAATTAAYQALGAETVQARAGKHGGKPIVYSEKLGDEWQPLSKFKGDATPEMAKGYVRGVPADVMLGSWDLAGNADNIMTDGRRVMRIDAGGMGPRTVGADPIQAWETGLSAFDEGAAKSEAARGGLRQKWAARAGGKQAAAKPERAEMPFMLAKSGGAQSLLDVKADLAAGLADVEKAIDSAGGELGFVKKHYPHLQKEDAAEFATDLGKRRQFLKDNIDKIAMATALAIGASMEDEGGASAAVAGGLAMALKKRGVGKVYVTPRRYNAQQHEVRIGQLKTLAENPQMPGAREARELYAAALKDRQQRPMNGEAGRWARTQKAFSESLDGLDASLEGAVKSAADKDKNVLRLKESGPETVRKAKEAGEAAVQKTMAAGERAVQKKTPEAAHKKLVRYGQQRKGELPLKQEIEATGRAAGVLPQLQDLRLIDPLEQLRNAMVTRPGVSRTPASPRGFLGATVDNMALRGLYPGLKSASGEMSPLRGGMLGNRVLQLGDNTPEDKSK